MQCSPYPIPRPHISNVVYRSRCKRGWADVQHDTYAGALRTDSFRSVSIKTLAPKSTTMFYDSHTQNSSGGKDISSTIASARAIECFAARNGGYIFVHDLCVRNVVYVVKLGFGLDVDKCAASFKKNLRYKPDCFKGLTLHMRVKSLHCDTYYSIRFKLFSSGKIVITTDAPYESVVVAYNILYFAVLVSFRPGTSVASNTPQYHMTSYQNASVPLRRGCTYVYGQLCDMDPVREIAKSTDNVSPYRKRYSSLLRQIGKWETQSTSVTLESNRKGVFHFVDTQNRRRRLIGAYAFLQNIGFSWQSDANGDKDIAQFIEKLPTWMKKSFSVANGPILSCSDPVEAGKALDLACDKICAIFKGSRAELFFVPLKEWPFEARTLLNDLGKDRNAWCLFLTLRKENLFPLATQQVVSHNKVATSLDLIVMNKKGLIGILELKCGYSDHDMHQMAQAVTGLSVKIPNNKYWFAAAQLVFGALLAAHSSYSPDFALLLVIGRGNSTFYAPEPDLMKVIPQLMQQDEKGKESIKRKRS